MSTSPAAPVPGRFAAVARMLIGLLRGLGRCSWPMMLPSTLWELPLSVCPRCMREFSCPVAWTCEDDSHWRIRLRCGECGHERETVVHNADAAELDTMLARHAAIMAAEAEALDRERMADQVEAFVAALERDLVSATDFV